MTPPLAMSFWQLLAEGQSASSMSTVPSKLTVLQKKALRPKLSGQHKLEGKNNIKLDVSKGNGSGKHFGRNEYEQNTLYKIFKEQIKIKNIKPCIGTHAFNPGT